VVVIAATTSGALKAYVEGLGLGLQVFRDSAPQNTPLPYVTVTENLTTTLNRDGDQADQAAQLTARELAQVSLWEQWRGADGKVLEAYGVGPTLARRLRGARLGPIGSRIAYGVTDVSLQRLLEEDANVVQTVITITVHREA
jgi:hypothetical protein